MKPKSENFERSFTDSNGEIRAELRYFESENLIYTQYMGSIDQGLYQEVITYQAGLVHLFNIEHIINDRAKANFLLAEFFKWFQQYIVVELNTSRLKNYVYIANNNYELSTAKFLKNVLKRNWKFDLHISNELDEACNLLGVEDKIFREKRYLQN